MDKDIEMQMLQRMTEDFIKTMKEKHNDKC